MGNGLVSVIVPVYNTERYIDRCVQSILNQTYRALEIFLLVGDTPDGSLEKCVEWRKKDRRITLVSWSNKGLGDARNYGVRLATGEFLSFVDSDDWIAPDYIGQLVLGLRSGADISCCDYVMAAADGTEQYRCGFPGGIAGENGVDFVRYAPMMPGVVWNKMFRRDWYTGHDLTFYDARNEDDAFHLVLSCLIKRVHYITKALYYYNTGNETSLMHQELKQESVVNSTLFALDWLRAHGLAQPYAHEIGRYVKRYLHHKAAQREDGGPLVLRCLDRLYPDYRRERQLRYAAFGSFNLRWTVHHLVYHPDQLRRECCFSSLIAQMSPPVRGIALREGTSPFRRRMLLQDFDGSLFDSLQEDPCDFFFLDFLEERFDVLQTGEGRYVTKSDALDECALPDSLAGASLVESGSPAYNALWRSACDRFIGRLKQRFQPDRVVLVRTRLALRYGATWGERPFAEQERIRAFNERIAEYEAYFIERFAGIHVIDLPEDRLYTGTDQKYGVSPVYLNQIVYSLAADKISGEILPLSGGEA